jgi:hypothetical protein
MGQKNLLSSHCLSWSKNAFTHFSIDPGRFFVFNSNQSVDLFTQIDLGIKIMKRSKVNRVPPLHNIIIIFVGYIYVFQFNRSTLGMRM